MRSRRPRDLFGHPIPAPRDKLAEARRQAAIVEYVRTVAPQLRILHVPNGGLRNKAEAAKLKWTGVLPGVTDLVVVLPHGRTAWWETKTATGRLTDSQRAFVAALADLGHSWAVVRGIDDARAELARLGIATREVAA